MLVGKAGAGKSAAGNTILRRENAFKAEFCFSSVTSECQKEEAEFDGKTLSIVDTPGLFNTDTDRRGLRKETATCISFVAPGPHVFLVVINGAVRFTKEEQDTIKIIQEIFGKEAIHYTMVLITHGDNLKKSKITNDNIKDHIGNENLLEFINQCKGGCYVIDNTDSDPSQVRELLKKIELMVERNGGRYYTNEMLQAVNKIVIETMMKHLLENVKMSLREARRRAERDNPFIDGVIAASLAVLGAAAGAGIEIGVGAIIGSVAGPLGAALGAAIGLAVGGIGAVVKKKYCALQ